ncbi:MAG TPA: hypothetical protein VFU02_19210 [Polyangiaceae bacterium]|nr:hypothetical protein [Polyangiaceae bacterium]
MLSVRPFLASALLVFGFVACDGDVLVGEFTPAGQGGAGGVDTTVTSVTTSSGGSAGASECIPRSCQSGPPYECGNCEDDDQDGFIDSEDPDCLGPCHNSESLYFGNIPGQDGGNCERECYFDSDAGVGNDDCRWNMRCDEREPEPDECPYDEAGVGSPPVSCEEAFGAPSQKCLDTCLPLVPNGCDCFGCCQIFGAPTPVWLGSEVDGQPSCDRGNVANPERCRPCTLNTECFNPCDECEICVGKPEPPPNCGNSEMPQECPPTAPVGCGLPGQSGCSVDYYCITGCCTLILK